MNENDLRGRMTLDVEPFRKELVGVERAVDKTTSTIDEKSKRIGLTWKGVAAGVGAAKFAYEAVKKVVEKGEIAQLAFGEAAKFAGETVDNLIRALGVFFDLIDKDTTTEDLKFQLILKGLTRELEATDKAIEKINQGATFARFQELFNSLGSTDVVQNWHAVNDTIDGLSKSLKDKKLAIEFSILAQQIGAGADAGQKMAAAFIKLRDSTTETAAIEFTEFERKLIVAAGNVEKKVKEIPKSFADGLEESVKRAEESFLKLQSIGQRVGDELQGSFSDGFFHAFDTGFSDLETTAKQVFESIRRSAFRLLSDIISTQLLKIIAGGISSAFLSSGSFVDTVTGERNLGGPGFEFPTGGGIASVTSSAGRFGGISIGGGIAAAAAAPVAVNITIQAWDGIDVERSLTRHRGLIVGIIDDANRRRPRQSGGGR